MTTTAMTLPIALTIAFLALLLAVLYVLPTIVAFVAGGKQWRRVMQFNLCFGWTLIGWVIALNKAVSE